MPKIKHLYAFVITDKDENDEGIPAITLMNNVYPLMGADMKRVEVFRRVAQKLANDKGKEVKLIKSTGIEIIETIKPEGTK